MPKALSLIVALFLALPAARVGAQDTANAINPEAVEFDSPVLDTPGIVQYQVELFPAGADPARDLPAATASLNPGAQRGDGRLRVDLKDLALELPNGRYIATVRAVASDRSIRTAPSAPFLLAHEGTPRDRVAAEKQDRFWTKVAMVIGGSLLLLPLAFR